MISCKMRGGVLLSPEVPEGLGSFEPRAEAHGAAAAPSVGRPPGQAGAMRINKNERQVAM